jgi:serine/threonine-protein kinase
VVSARPFTEPAILHPGDRLGRYELLCPLAYGGMAAVWLARQKGSLGFEKLVVVKTILPQYAEQEQFQRMFLDEARVASAIDHPNVARTLDVGKDGELVYLVMEWVDGESLSRLMRAVASRQARERGAEGVIPAGIVLRLMADACAGLHAAHELRDRNGNLLGVVHRDVSPQNVLVSSQGAAKIIDFGVAKARDRAASGTSAGQIKGKVRYMSPEQAVGREVDRRADIWSLGAMLFEMFTGQAPFDGPNEVATLHRLTSGEPAANLVGVVPPGVAAIVARALRHNPDDRFATAAEMQIALEEAMLEVQIATTTAHVAAFLEAQVGDRARARKKSVETALAVANRRTENPADADRPSLRSSQQIPVEAPSRTSTATLGAAAVEWPPSSWPIRPVRRRRANVILGLLAAAGALFLVGFLATRGPGPKSSGALAAPTPPPATDFVPSSEPEITSTPLTPNATAGMPATTGIGAAALRARPPAPRPPVAKPPPPPPAPAASAPKKRDYGF